MPASPGGVATSLATQALLSAGTGRHWMKSVPLLSSQDGPGRVQLEDFGPTRNRKVEGSNPSSGSKTPGQRVFLRMLTAQRQEAGHSFGSDITPPGALAHFAGGCSAGTSSAVDGSPLSATPGGIVEGGRLWRADDWAGPAGRARIRAQSQNTNLRCAAVPTFQPRGCLLTPSVPNLMFGQKSERCGRRG